MTARVAEVLRRHAVDEARLTLGLSGGLDSVVLLDVLSRLRSTHAFQLRAFHVHHGLSQNADAWTAFCERLCVRYGVPLDIHCVTIAGDDPDGIEAAARRERYRVFAALDVDAVLTAHQQDDQAETLLLQLLRGAGPKGLASMAEARRPPDWRALHLRPLLGLTRGELHDHAMAEGLEWVDDESNQVTRFRRNALRHQIMPELARHFPGSVSTLARAAELQADAAALLDDLARADAMNAVHGDRLACAALARLDARRARNLLRYFIELQGYRMPPKRALDDALRQLVHAAHDARLRLKLGDAELWRYRGGAYLVAPAPALHDDVRWHGEAILPVPAAGVQLRLRAAVGDGLRRDALDAAEVTAGVRRGGERLRLHPGGPRRSLKNLFQERGVPPWQRARLPLLRCDGVLVWVAGFGWDADWAAAPGEPGLVPVVDGERPMRDSEDGRVLS